MRNYKLELTNQAASVLQKMALREPQIYKRVAKALSDLEKDPFQGKLLKGQLHGLWSYRIGSYRVVYRLYREKLLVIIINIGHRRDIYH